MPTCQGQTKEGRACLRKVRNGTRYCQLHQPVDSESWREVYEQLVKATPNEKADIVLRLVDEHSQGHLELPEREGVRADLSGVDLSTSTLKLKLEEAKDGTPRWWNDSLDCASFVRANLEGAILWGANLEGTQVSMANLRHAWMSNASLQNAMLDFTNFEGALLDELSDLHGAELSDANFQNAHLVNVNLQKSNLSGANLLGAFLMWVNLRGSTLAGANLQDVRLDEVDLTKVDLSNAKLQGVDLTNSTISHIYISGAWLEKTKLRLEQLGGAIGEEKDGNYGEAKLGYMILKQNFESLGDYTAASITTRLRYVL